METRADKDLEHPLPYLKINIRKEKLTELGQRVLEILQEVTPKISSENDDRKRADLWVDGLNACSEAAIKLGLLSLE